MPPVCLRDGVLGDGHLNSRFDCSALLLPVVAAETDAGKPAQNPVEIAVAAESLAVLVTPGSNAPSWPRNVADGARSIYPALDSINIQMMYTFSFANS